MIFNLFRKGKDKDNSTYEERLEKLERSVAKNRTDILDIYTDIDGLRDKVLRKIQNRPKDLNTSTDSDNVISRNPRLLGGKAKYGRTQ
jgi:uncharacterized protein (UPF0335 family)